ncbi:MAG: O-antigen ligase family protein, partial [Lentisphaeria bacterium]|nr:O-antigen ligase family protein [Lentisphaeria bacterium]
RAPLRRHPAVAVLWLWGGLLLVSTIGLLRTTEWDYALTFLLGLAGTAAYLAAFLKLSLVDPGARRWVLASVAAGTVLCGAIGWHQRLWGFREMRRYAEQQARESSQTLSVAMQGKLEQTRVFRPFFLPNSYAAHLVLTGPLALLVLWRAGGRFEPAKVSRALFAGAGAAVVFGALLLSGSRGAQLGLGGGLGLAALSIPSLRRWRWGLLPAALCLGILLMLAVNRGRDMLSANARVQYYTAALTMTAQHPLTGVGLGEFFPHYLRLKPVGAEETRAPHNMILNLLSQAGIAGGAAALAVVLLPAWLGLCLPLPRRHPDVPAAAAAIAGVGAWSLHALLDFNIQIPPTVMVAALLPVFCWAEPAFASGTVTRPRRLENALLAALALAAVAALWRVPGELRYRRLADAVETMPAALLREDAEAAAVGLPLSPYPWVVYGRTAFAEGACLAAADAFARACRRAPHRSAFLVQWAEALLAAGDVTAAEGPAERACRWYPTSGRALATRALTQALAGGDVPQQQREAWVRALVLCRPATTLEDGTLRVHLEWPEGVAANVSLAALADILSRTRPRTPGASFPVIFTADGSSLP